MLHTVEEWTLLGRYALNTLTDNALVIDTRHTFAMPLRHLLYCLHNYQAVANIIPIDRMIFTAIISVHLIILIFI